MGLRIDRGHLKKVKQALSAPSVSVRSIFQEFGDVEVAGGVLMLASAVLALAWANSPWAEQYFRLWEMELSIGIGQLVFSKSLHAWVNDGLMALFFFVVGLEIKREVLAGELSAPRRAALPIAAAFGGMLLPALVYTLFNAGGPAARGWGIPVATDIAFTLGVLALLKRRVPAALKVFFAALAIADDIGAVLIIALFYTGEIIWLNVAAAAAIMLGLVALNQFKVTKPMPYALLGVALWLALLESGFHATIAGVLVAMTIPARTHVDVTEYLEEARALLDADQQAGAEGHDVLAGGRRQSVAQALEHASELVETPLQRLEHALHPWVSYVVIPLFALANAGVSFEAIDPAMLLHPLTIGVAAGLVLGKPLGVSLLAWLAVRVGLAELPDRVSWPQLFGASWLAGIGFTMSLFIASLAFEDGDMLVLAKLGIMAASVIAGTVGWLLVRVTSDVEQQQERQLDMLSEASR